jgi:hypothetical protein
MLNNRRALLEAGLAQLPTHLLTVRGRNGESLAHDEASVWKRVLNLRLVTWMRPSLVIETHPGLGISTALYRRGCSKVTSLSEAIEMRAIPSASIFDVDPFGAPWDTVRAIVPFMKGQTILQVSNGEAQAVRRNLRKAQKFPTRFFGVRMPRWVLEEYVPRLEDQTKSTAAFFYAFPTTIRVILSRRPLPQWLWEDCPRWMWWLSKYAPVGSC